MRFAICAVKFKAGPRGQPISFWLFSARGFLVPNVVQVFTAHTWYGSVFRLPHEQWPYGRITLIVSHGLVQLVGSIILLHGFV